MLGSRRFIFLLVVLALMVTGHAWIINRQAMLASSASRDGPPITVPYQLIRPEFAVDGHMWIHYAVRLLDGEGPQLRKSTKDNAPLGREVHWNSGYAWWIALWGWGWQKVTGLPITQATERAAMWLNAPLIIGFTLLFAVWTARRWGWKTGLIVGASMVFMPSLYEGFWPGYADHHGLISASIVGLTLGAAMMRGGWLAREEEATEGQAVSAARFSGIWGGVGLWISAASAIPLIALVAASSLAASAMTRRELSQKAVFSPAVWRAWGATGAVTSLLLYLLEYFPFHLDWRLEVNHPLYALAWLAGAELTARIMPLVTGQVDEKTWRSLWRTAAWAIPAALAPAVAIVIWRAKVFMPIDPFMAGLHRTIVEFLPQMQRVEIDGYVAHLNTLLFSPLVYIVGLFFLLARSLDRWRMSLALGLTLPLYAMGFHQSRWIMNASPGQLLIVITVLQGLPRIPWFAVRRWRVICGTSLLLLLTWGPGMIGRLEEVQILLRQTGITVSDGRQLLYREVAQAIRISQPQGEVVVLGSPNTSVNVGFYGDFKTLGTLYWENLDGLKAAAEIISARSEDEAARLIKARGVTHLAMFRAGNYVLEYAALLRPGITLEEAQSTFGYRLLAGRQVPLWLEALPYAAPTGLPNEIDREILVFKVNFTQESAGAAYNLAMLQFSREETDDALRSLAQALAFDPAYYPAAIRRGEYFVSRQDWARAQESFELAAAIAPTYERYRLLTQTAIGFASKKELARAIAFYDRALAENATPTIAANNLAWILATASEAKLRNPARALELARQCAASQADSPISVGTLAAALAATGQFEDAASTLERAIGLARQQGLRQLLPQMEERLAAYRKGELWLAP